MIHELRIPTDQYAYINVQFEGTPDEALEEYRRLSNLFKDGKTDSGGFKEIVTFTGETVLYNPISHQYKSLDGKRLVSGSAYKKSLEAPFPETMALTIAEKYGMKEEEVRTMWKLNGNASTSFGSALHSGLELYRKYSHLVNEKNYFLPKNPTIREAVLAFPELESKGHSEIMVSAVEKGMVGQIDWLQVTGGNTAIVEDYKSDADVKKNLKGHFNQLSFYAHILIHHGWNIPSLAVWNWDGKAWTKYESPVLDLIIK